MNISVYLGSSTACKPEFNKLAYDLGYKIATAGHTLVYGGANVGTMKCLADGATDGKGKIIGVFPSGFKGTAEVSGMKIIREDCYRFFEVPDFSQRKLVMQHEGDCCVVLPGSYGTLDELFTYACERSIHTHEKPIYILNWKGYYNPIKDMIKNMDEAGFLKPSTLGILNFVDTLDELPF